MTNWKATVHVGDFWRDESKTIIEKRDLTVARIKASEWKAITRYSDELDRVIADFAEVTDVREFDWALEELYDIADADLVWIETHARSKA